MFPGEAEQPQCTDNLQKTSSSSISFYWIAEDPRRLYWQGSDNRTSTLCIVECAKLGAGMFSLKIILSLCESAATQLPVKPVKSWHICGRQEDPSFPDLHPWEHSSAEQETLEIKAISYLPSHNNIYAVLQKKPRPRISALPRDLRCPHLVRPQLETA